MVLDVSLLNTQHYKVRIKGKVEPSRERSITLLIHLGVVAIEKGAFESPSTKGANFTYIYCYSFFCFYCLFGQAVHNLFRCSYPGHIIDLSSVLLATFNQSHLSSIFLDEYCTSMLSVLQFIFNS